MRDRPFTVWTHPPGAKVPDTRSEARRLEIVPTFDAWQAERFAIDASSAWDAAAEAACTAGATVGAIEVEILATAPLTLAGLAAKARWARTGEWARQVAADVVALAEGGGAAS